MPLQGMAMNLLFGCFGFELVRYNAWDSIQDVLYTLVRMRLGGTPALHIETDQSATTRKIRVHISWSCPNCRQQCCAPAMAISGAVTVTISPMT